MKPAIAVLWILSIALAVGLTRLAEPERSGSGPVPSFAEAFREVEPLERAQMISTALQHLGSDNLPELKAVLEEGKMGIETEEVRLIMLAWARFDPSGAYEWARNGPKNWRQTLTDEAMYAWAYYDGPAALEVVEAVEDEDRKARLRQNMIEGWLRSGDKDGVSLYIANFPDMKRRGRLIFLLAGELVLAEGEEGAMRWVEALPDDAPNLLKLGLFHHVAKMVAVKDPVRAAEWFWEHRTRSYTEGALEGIARRWVQHHDRPAAFAWLLAMESDGLRAGERSDAIGDGFRSWIQIDPDAAQEWLDSALPNPELDPAIEEAVKRLLPTDPDLSMAWAQRFDDDEQRDRHTVRAGRRWREKDPEAFETWLASAELSDELREKILTAPVRGPRMTVKPKPPAAAGKP